jgi:hypothetical protein
MLGRQDECGRLAAGEQDLKLDLPSAGLLNDELHR